MSLSNKLSITDVDLSGKRVLIRVSPPDTDHPTLENLLIANLSIKVDFNVPLDADKKVTNTLVLSSQSPKYSTN